MFGIIRNERVLRILKEPKVLMGKLKGFYPNQCYYILTASKLVDKPFKTIIDVGANYGYFIKPAKWLFPEADRYAFEPVFEAYNKIKDIKGVKCFNFGLSDKNVESDFYYNAKSEGSSTFLKPTEKYTEISDGKIIKRKAKLKRFDSLNIKIRRPCFLKIDTEGFDYFVLKGFGKLLNEVDIIQIEYHFKDYFEGRPKLSEIMKLLEGFGFTSIIQTEVHDKGCDLMFFKGKS